MLQFGGYRECREDDYEDEDVVDRKRLFDDVARQELQGAFRAVPMVDAQIEEQRERDPDRCPRQRLLQLHHMGSAVEDAEVQRQHQQDEKKESGPEEGGADRRGGHRKSPSAA